jgi:large subunit ribosomal protein L25
MAEFVVEADKRVEFGKNASRRLRATGRIPGVVYGRNFETVSVAVDPKRITEVLASESGRNTIFSLRFGGRSTDVLIKDYLLDPLKGTLLHADFQHVSMDELMDFRVPVEISGSPVGVKSGGVLDLVLRDIEVECLPGDVPDEIVVRVDDLDIGDAIRVSELKVESDKVKILTDPDLVVLTVVPPRAEEELVEEEEEAVAEPEVVRRGRVEPGEEAEDEG